MNDNSNIVNDPIFWINICILFVALMKYTLKYCLRYCRYKHLKLCCGLVDLERDPLIDYNTDKLRIEHNLETESNSSSENKEISPQQQNIIV